MTEWNRRTTANHVCIIVRDARLGTPCPTFPSFQQTGTPCLTQNTGRARDANVGNDVR